MSAPREVVLDASAGVALLLQEQLAPQVDATIRQHQTAGTSMVVPPVFWLEVVNAIDRGKQRTGARALEAIAELDALGLETAEQDRAAVLLTIDLVERHGLISYDASYLALVIQRDARLLTLDRDLAVAAGTRAIAIGEGHGLAETTVAFDREVTWPDYRGAAGFLARLRADALSELEAGGGNRSG